MGRVLGLGVFFVVCKEGGLEGVGWGSEGWVIVYY